MMSNLEFERLVLAAMAGIGKRCLYEMNKYASEREAFGKMIRDFGQIQRHIGQSYAKYRSMRHIFMILQIICNLEKPDKD